MNKKLKCYFAHPYETRFTPEEKEIIEEIKSRRLELIEPFAEEDNLLKKYGVKEYYSRPYYELGREMWTKDLGKVRSSDILIAYMPEDVHAKGTMAEVVTAYEWNQFKIWMGKQGIPYKDSLIFIQIISPMKHPSFTVYPDQLFETIGDWKNHRQFRWLNYRK